MASSGDNDQYRTRTANPVWSTYPCRLSNFLCPFTYLGDALPTALEDVAGWEGLELDHRAVSDLVQVIREVEVVVGEHLLDGDDFLGVGDPPDVVGVG